jgi:hypothetical protein
MKYLSGLSVGPPEYKAGMLLICPRTSRTSKSPLSLTRILALSWFILAGDFRYGRNSRYSWLFNSGFQYQEYITLDGRMIDE